MTRAFQVLIEGTAEAAEAFARGGAKAVTAGEAAAEAGADAGAAASGGKEAIASAAGKGKSLFSKGTDWAKKNPKKTLLGAGIAGVTTAAVLGGDDDHQPIRGVNSLLDRAGLPTLDDIAGTGHGTGAGTGAGHGAGEIEIDTEVLAAFAVELRRAADSLHTAPGEMKNAIAQLVQHYSTDGSGTPTRDGQSMPCAAGTVKALEQMGHHYAQVVSGIISQLTHDAAAIDQLCRTHDDTEREHAGKFHNIDTNLTME